MLGPVLPPKRALCHRYADYVLLAFGRYEQPVLRTLVQQIKFKRYQGLATVAGNLMGEQLSEFAGAFDVVVPIPLSAQRLRERGFNQAGVLAERLSIFLAATYRPECIVRTRNTVAQTTLRSYADRAKNLTGCFEVAEPATIVGKSVLLVDDVWTSGATMGTAAQVLVRAGARRVVGVVIARV
jgi:ComF family protein